MDSTMVDIYICWRGCGKFPTLIGAKRRKSSSQKILAAPRRKLQDREIWRITEVPPQIKIWYTQVFILLSTVSAWSWWSLAKSFHGFLHEPLDNLSFCLYHLYNCVDCVWLCLNNQSGSQDCLFLMSRQFTKFLKFSAPLHITQKHFTKKKYLLKKNPRLRYRYADLRI